MFLLNPYEQEMDLCVSDDEKRFRAGIISLDSTQKYDGSKGKKRAAFF